jgi:hypothetical protein
MSDTFLVTFLHLAIAITGAERGMALDSKNNVLALEKIQMAETSADDFTGFENVKQAYNTKERPHISNNTILDPEFAPNTNTNFSDLRIVIVFTLGEHGAVYIDQHVTKGVIKKEDTEKLIIVADYAMTQNMLHADQDTLKDIYNTL